MIKPHNTQQPSIRAIKKGALKGGAWKVAYADFVTAMMAFFLLMWLLNATEAEQLAGLADYFAPTQGISGEMGIGFRGGKAAISDGIGADLSSNKGIVFGGVPSGPIVKVTKEVEIETRIEDDQTVSVNIGSGESEADQEDVNFSSARDALEEFVQGEAEESGLNEMIDITQTIEGLEIQIKDSRKESMFEVGTAIIKPRIKKLVEKIAIVINSLPNYVAITGHVRSIPVRLDDKEYTNWELSTDRANSVRRLLLENKVQDDRINKVIGKSDNEPMDPTQPDHPVNSRVSIVLLRDAVLPYHKQVAPDEIFLDPDAKGLEELIDEQKTNERRAF